MNLVGILIISVLCGGVLSQKKFKWSDCGSKEVTIQEINLNPMPIEIPSKVDFNFKATLKRPINGTLRAKLNVNKKLIGFVISLECFQFMVGKTDVKLGSCYYEDLCQFLNHIFPNTLNKPKCYSNDTSSQVDCICPFNHRSNVLEFEKSLYIPKLPEEVKYLLKVGDFNVRAELSDDLGPYSCVDMKLKFKIL